MAVGSSPEFVGATGSSFSDGTNSGAHTTHTIRSEHYSVGSSCGRSVGNGSVSPNASVDRRSVGVLYWLVGSNSVDDDYVDLDFVESDSVGPSSVGLGSIESNSVGLNSRCFFLCPVQ